MYPQDYNYQQAPARSKKPLVIGLVAVAFVIIGLILWVALQAASSPTSDSSSVEDPKYTLNPTALKASQNFSTLKDNDIYSYNGLAFYKQSLDNGQLTILSKGLKLPQASSITWVGSKGALMTFKNSYLATPVYDLLSTQPKSTDERIAKYVWYVDFATNRVSLLSTAGIAVSQIAVPAAGNGFYYAGPVVQNSTKQSFTPLNFYTFSTGKMSTAIADLGMNDIASLAMCASGQKICITGRENISQPSVKLYVVDPAGGKQTAATVNGRIFTTSNPDKYVLADNSSSRQGAAYSQKSKTGEITEDTDTDTSGVEAKLYDVASKSTEDLGFTVSLNTIYTSFAEDGSFTVLDSSYNAKQPRSTSVEDYAPAYRAGTLTAGEVGKSKLFPLVLSDGKAFDDTVITAAYGKDYVLLTNSKQEQLALGKKTSASPSLTAADKAKITETVTACLPSGGPNATVSFDSSNATYQVSLIYDTAFASKIANYSTCITSKGSSTLNGYNYTFSGIDPVIGRRVTD